MSRIKAVDATVRYQFVTEYFTQNPQATIKSVNEILYQQCGKRMNLNRIYAIRKQVQVSVSELGCAWLPSEPAAEQAA